MSNSSKNTAYQRRMNQIVIISIVITSILIQQSNSLINNIGSIRTNPKLYAINESKDKFKRSLSSSLSWSKSASPSKISKRERIKNVLAKAKRRTSSIISNKKLNGSDVDRILSIEDSYDIVSKSYVEDDVSSLADAASIGSSGDFYVEKNGVELNGVELNGVELNGKAKVNGKAYEKNGKTPEHETEKNGIQSPVNTVIKPKETKVETKEAVVEIKPLPFTLPTLTAQQKQDLENGERIQHQQDMGREGSGFVVVDVKAPPSTIWQCLLDFESYPTLIDTVRDVSMYTSTHLSQEYYHEDPVDTHNYCGKLKYGIPSITRAAFTLSKFRLNIAAIHSYKPHPHGDHMIFTLDPACTNLVLRAAKGIWYTQVNPDGKEGVTRVWLLCEVKVSSVLPMWITYYAAKRAMPRATTWLKPTVEKRFNK